MNPTPMQRLEASKQKAELAASPSWSLFCGLRVREGVPSPSFIESDPWQDSLFAPDTRSHSEETAQNQLATSEQSMVAALLGERIRLILENRRLHRELEQERGARLAVEQNRSEETSAALTANQDDVTVFGEPTSRRSTHLRIVSRAQVTPLIDPTEFAE
jgi:hypothetical protein